MPARFAAATRRPAPAMARAEASRPVGLSSVGTWGGAWRLCAGSGAGLGGVATDACTQGWAESERGVSYTFGADVVSKFLEDHDFDLMVRAHQVVEDGYEFFAQRQLVTLFSAPNYCGEFDNSGAVMSVDASLMCSFHILKPRSAAPGTPDTVGRGAR